MDSQTGKCSNIFNDDKINYYFDAIIIKRIRNMLCNNIIVRELVSDSTSFVFFNFS